MNNFEALTKIATLLAESKVKETLEYYHEPADKAPPLSECVQWLESCFLLCLMISRPSIPSS